MLYFIRHGNTDWTENKNASGQKDPKCQGRCDISLNATGIAQAKALKEKLKGIKFDKVYCSPLTRCRQTLEYSYSGDAPIIFDDRLTERDFGKFEGLTRSEFDFSSWWNSKKEMQFETGESIFDVQKRVFAFLDEANRAGGGGRLITF